MTTDLVFKRLALFFAVCLYVEYGLAQELDIHHLDVGQGDATFFVVKDSTGAVVNTVLIDGGLKRYGQPIINYITNTLGIHTINYLIASHYDADHVAGLAVILNNGLNSPTTLVVDSVLDRGDSLYPDPKQGRVYKVEALRYQALGRRRTLWPGDTLKLFNDVSSGTLTGAYNISMLCLCVNGYVLTSPITSVINPANPDENDLSTGFLLKYGKFKYLTCGDIGGKHGPQAATCDGSYGCNFADIETNIVALSGQVSAYKVNHHGSRCSTNDAWVRLAASPVAVISSGKNGRYKHPRAEVVQALNAADSMVNFYMTAPVNYYNRVLLPKGILNPAASQPVNLVVNRTNNGINITTRSVFTVQGTTYTKY